MEIPLQRWMFMKLMLLRWGSRSLTKMLEKRSFDQACGILLVCQLLFQNGHQEKKKRNKRKKWFLCGFTWEGSTSHILMGRAQFHYYHSWILGKTSSGNHYLYKLWSGKSVCSCGYLKGSWRKASSLQWISTIHGCWQDANYAINGAMEKRFVQWKE